MLLMYHILMELNYTLFHGPRLNSRLLIIRRIKMNKHPLRVIKRAINSCVENGIIHLKRTRVSFACRIDFGAKRTQQVMCLQGDKTPMSQMWFVCLVFLKRKAIH